MNKHFTSFSMCSIPRGLSLTELLIVLAISSILLAISAPNFKDFQERLDAKNKIKHLHQLIHYTRLQALNSQIPTRICPSKNGSNCDDEWLNGLLIFQDPDKDKSINHDHEKLYYQGDSQMKGDLQWTGLHNHILFSGDGLAGNSAGSFIYCPESQNELHAQALIISFAGRIRMAIDADEDGIVETGSQKNVACGG